MLSPSDLHGSLEQLKSSLRAFPQAFALHHYDGLVPRLVPLQAAGSLTSHMESVEAAGQQQANLSFFQWLPTLNQDVIAQCLKQLNLLGMKTRLLSLECLEWEW